MKPKAILAGLTALWALVVLLEGASTALRCLYSRRMGTAVRAASGLIGYAKAALLIALALSNAVLFLRHVDDDVKR